MVQNRIFGEFSLWYTLESESACSRHGMYYYITEVEDPTQKPHLNSQIAKLPRSASLHISGAIPNDGTPESRDG